jgi:hypothetical protein
MAHFPDLFILDEHLPRYLAGLDPDADVEEVQERPGVEWLPDVSFSHVGMKYRDNKYQA